MDLRDFELIYKENRIEIKDKSKIASKLAEIVGNENVSTKEVDLLAYSKDSTLLSFNWEIEGKIAGLADFATDLEPVLAGQHHVKKQQVRVLAIQHAKPAPRVIGTYKIDPKSLEVGLQQIGVLLVVVDDHDFGHGENNTLLIAARLR